MENPTFVMMPNSALKQILSDLAYLKSKVEDSNKIESEILNVKEAAILIKSTPGSIYVMASKGTIPCIRRNGKLYFKRSELLTWIESGTTSIKK